MNIIKFVKIVKKVVENLTRGVVNPHRLCEEWKCFWKLWS